MPKGFQKDMIDGEPLNDKPVINTHPLWLFRKKNLWKSPQKRKKNK